MDRLEDPSGGSDLQGYLSDDLHVLIGLSGGSSLLVSADILIQRFSRDSPSDSYLRLSLVDIVEQYITQCINITVHYAHSVVVIKYVKRVLRVIWV